MGERSSLSWQFNPAAARALLCGALLSAACSTETHPGDRAGVVVPVASPGATAGAGGTLAAPPLGGIAGSAAGADPDAPATPLAAPLPCEVSTVVQRNCQSCHGNPLIGGAPMPLVTHADFMRDHVVRTTPGMIGQTVKVHELARIRLNSTSAPMPPGGQMPVADHAALDGWLASGALAGGEADRACAGGSPNDPTRPNDPADPAVPPISTSQCDSNAYEPLVERENETCYELLVHGGGVPDDTSKYEIVDGEHYEQFYYDVPWPTGVQGTRFGARFDNLQVLHHWLLFTSGIPRAAGTHETVIGTQLGDVNAQLLGGWAVGGCNVEFPEKMGLQLPPSGTSLNVQWHFYNSTGAPQLDGSAVQICTVPAGTRPNTGSLTWLGTEDFYGPLGMPPGENQFAGTCPNDSPSPITIVAFWPHMHELGRRMTSVVTRASGVTEQVFDEPFDFNRQIHYRLEPNVVLQPGDTITSTCAFDNITDGNVAFGPSTKQEMCYQFAFSYPAGQLDNGVISLIGATNTCW